MKKNIVKTLSIMLTFAFVLTSVLGMSNFSFAAVKPKKIQLNTKKETLYVGEQYQIGVKSTMPKKASKAVKYTVSKEGKKIVTIKKNGLLKGIKKGKATVTVASTKNSKAKATITVTVKKGIPSKKIYMKNINLVMGKKANLAVTWTPANTSSKKLLDWKSSNKKVVTINKVGQVTAVSAGTSRITVKNSYGKTAKCTITVNAPTPGVLKEAYKDLFSIGTAVTSSQLLSASESDKLNHVVEQYNSITMENEMKPDAILRSTPQFEEASFDRSTLPAGYAETKIPKLNFSTIDQCLTVAKNKGLKMRGHTLVWHSQTPAWFFKKDYSTASNAALVDKTVMNARMEFYIKSVLEHVQQSDYKDVIYAWDVCNEVLTNDGATDYKNALRGGNSNAYEFSNWYSIYKSDEFVINAFKYAKKYKDTNVKLFYNDYNEYIPNKTANIVTLATKLYDEGMNTDGSSLIDGIGMQSHIDLNYPDVNTVETAIKEFSKIGNGALEIQLTELDVTLNFNKKTGHTLNDQTVYYGDLMKMIVNLKRNNYNITNVTLWGFYDQMSWRKENTPLLFNYYSAFGFSPKAAFKSVLEAPLQTLKQS